VIKSRKILWAGQVACMGDRRDSHRILVGTTEGKRALARREDNIKMALQEV
jgi:hypothetical protein